MINISRHLRHPRVDLFNFHYYYLRREVDNQKFTNQTILRQCFHSQRVHLNDWACSKSGRNQASNYAVEIQTRSFSNGSHKDSAGSPLELKQQIKSKRQSQFVPRKAAVKLTENSRKIFKTLLENAPDPNTIGIFLKYQQSSSGEPRMVFTFEFVKEGDVGKDDEGVSLEILQDGTPKPPSDSWDDGLQKLYVHSSAFLKVLGGTLDVDTEKGSFTPILYDREGNILDPNA